MRTAAVVILIARAVSVCAVARAEPMRPVQKTATRSDLLAEIATEERAITMLLAEIAQLESRRAVVERSRARLSGAGSVVLPALEGRSAGPQEAAWQDQLRKELANVGIALSEDEAANLVRAIGKGDDGAMGVALALVVAIADVNLTTAAKATATARATTATDAADAGPPKIAPSRHAASIKRLALAPSTVNSIVDEMAKAPEAVPLQRTELTRAAKPAKTPVGDHVLAVATKSYATYVASLTASIDAAKANLAERQRRLSALRHRLDALGPETVPSPARVVKP